MEPLRIPRLSGTHEALAPSHTREERAKEPHGVRRSIVLSRSILSRPGLSLFSVSFARAERPILISIMTRNGCWRECSSLSVAPVPVVYLSGTRTAPFHPGEKHRGSRNCRFQPLFFLRVHVVCPPSVSRFRSARLFLSRLSPNLYATGVRDAFPGITLNHSVLCITHQHRGFVYTRVRDWFFWHFIVFFLQKRLWEFDDHEPADHRRYHGLPADVPHLLSADPLLLRRTFHRHMWVDVSIWTDCNFRLDGIPSGSPNRTIYTRELLNWHRWRLKCCRSDYLYR